MVDMAAELRAGPSQDEIGSPASLFALICRTRIAQLEGDVALCEKEASAIWRTLPRASAKSMSLLLGSFAMTRAVDYFFTWEPFSELRHGVLMRDPASERRRQALAQLELHRKQAICSGRIPESIMGLRAARAKEVPMPVHQDFFERLGFF